MILPNHMQESRLIMGMPITVEIVDPTVSQEALNQTFTYFEYVDKKFSTYKDDSEITRINNGELDATEYSPPMREILLVAEETKQITNGYFDITKTDGKIDPSGIVKGWAIYNAAKLLLEKGFHNFYIEAGGDIQAEGLNSKGEKWSVGIRNPFNNDPSQAIIKVINISNCGMATSGNYLRGDHIYNPKQREKRIDDIVSLTIIGPNVYEADRFATAAFAMGKAGIQFIESLPGFEGYLVEKNGQATLTTGFSKFCVSV